MTLENLPLANSTKGEKLLLPLVNERISAGFPSPAEDYIDRNIDLNETLIQNPISTFFLRVSGNSMTGAGIQDGDLLVVDRSINPSPGHIVIAILDGSFTVKRLTRRRGLVYLEAENPNYPPIDLRQYGEVQIWGIALYSIHDLIKTSRH